MCPAMYWCTGSRRRRRPATWMKSPSRVLRTTRAAVDADLLTMPASVKASSTDWWNHRSKRRCRGWPKARPRRAWDLMRAQEPGRFPPARACHASVMNRPDERPLRYIDGGDHAARLSARRLPSRADRARMTLLLVALRNIWGTITSSQHSARRC